MSAQISHIPSDSLNDENAFRNPEKHEAGTKDTIDPFVADLEGEGLEFEKQKLREKVEAVELIPTEAFQWNVDGDQSPCEFPKPSNSRLSKTYMNTSSSRGRCLCLEYG